MQVSDESERGDDMKLSDRTVPAWLKEIVHFVAKQHHIKQTVDQLPKMISSMEATIAGQNQIIRGLNQGVGTLGRMFQDLLQTSQLLENASKEQKLLSERHYQEHVIDPLVRSVVPLVHLVDEARQNSSPDEGGSNHPTVLDAVHKGIQEFLFNYGLELFQSKQGAAFDRQSMLPIQIESTNVKNLDFTVARSLRCGARRDQRILRPEDVVVYRFEAQAARTAVAAAVVNKNESFSTKGE